MGQLWYNMKDYQILNTFYYYDKSENETVTIYDPLRLEKVAIFCNESLTIDQFLC